jgi:hypothetical protein
MQSYFPEHHCFLILKKIIRTGGSITPNSFERKFQQLCDSENIYQKEQLELVGLQF